MRGPLIMASAVATADLVSALPSDQLQNPECLVDAAKSQCQIGWLPSVVFGAALPLVFVLVAIVMYVVYTRRRTRRELEGGRCNLPTVVWRPRFMNYTTREEEDGASEEDVIDWDNDDVAMDWARKFLEENPSACQPSDERPVATAHKRQRKMGSSSITNILPRMERLGGPYGLYATVYGIQTKVVHVAHPVPARAILTGGGVVEGDGIGEAVRRSPSISWEGALREIKRIVFSTAQESAYRRESFQKRRRSSSLRMLTGSTKNPAYDHFKNFSGEGVFTANGSDWKTKRASVVHCLLRAGGTEESLEMEANRAADSFDREVSFSMGREASSGTASRATRGSVINVVPMLQRSTIGLIYRLITHHDIEFSPQSTSDSGMGGTGGEKTSSLSSSPTSSATSLASMGEDVYCHRENATNFTTAQKCKLADGGEQDEKEKEIKSLLPTYLGAVTTIRMIVLAQSRSVWYLLPRWVYRTFSPMYREEERTMVPIREFARLTCENAAVGSPLSLLSERSSHSAENGVQSNASAGKRVPKDLLDEAITLLFAGQDTSAATLSWTLHLLSLHPEKQERVADEVRSVLGKSDTDPVSKSMISQLPYLDAVIKESMRLYPVAPFIVRKLTTDVCIPVDEETSTSENICMPASTFACIWIYALHRNPKLWDRPDDFLPERWIDPELRGRDLGQREHGAYMPFAIGPRNCLGQPLAQVILRVLLARIMNKYVVLDPKFEALQKLGKEKGLEFNAKCLRKDMQAGFTVLPSNGLKLQLKERNSSR